MTTPKLPVMSMAVLISFTSVSHAEVNLDGTLGPKIELPGPHFKIEADMGELKDKNLFHSFKDFNINTGESATFRGPDSVENVISRVTGGNQSLIDGALRSEIPNANLYLVNPRGILFGKNAHLDITGSFHASTADYLQFEDGNRFYATTPEKSLLSVAPLSSFGFLNKPLGNITLKGSHLQVENQKTLSLIGGDLALVDGSGLSAPDGKINLISAASHGDVVPGVSNSAEKWGNLSLVAGKKPNEYARVDTSGLMGGDIFIQGGQFLSVGGQITSKVLKNTEDRISTPEQRGKITLLAQDKINMIFSNLAVDAEEGTHHDAGDILIETRTMVLKQPCPKCGMSSDTFGEGNSGDITITASEDFKMTGTGISAVSGKGETGNAGHIHLTVGQLTLEKGGFLNSGTLGSGNGGDIDIQSDEGVSLAQGSLISTTSKASGNGGNIDIKAPRLEITDSSAVQSGAFSSSTGNAGDIQIGVDHLVLENYSTIIASNAGNEKSGKIIVSSRDSKLKKSSIFLFNRDKNETGSIRMMTDNLLLDHSLITGLADQGNGGEIDLQVSNELRLEESFIITRVYGSKEAAGDIDLDVQRFMIDNGQLLTMGRVGDGGNINIDTDHFTILGNSRIDVSSKHGVNGQFLVNSVQLEDELLASPPPELLPKSELSLNRCEELTPDKSSSFYIFSREKSPIAPGDLQTGRPYVPPEDDPILLQGTDYKSFY